MIWELDGIAPQDQGALFIAPDAQVMGRVILGEGASVWWGAVLRGDTEAITVGRGTNVQDLCCFHTDPGCPLTIGVDCTIGHRAILHGCTVGDGVLIGMGATVLNGAKIGDGALIGAGALVAEGKVIPPGALVMGAPGRVVRELSAEARAGLLDSAARYRERAAHFRDRLKRVGG